MNMQEMEKPQELSKSSYTSPKLFRLGNVKQVTEGMSKIESTDYLNAGFS